MTIKKLNLFIPITKVDEENRLVYGTLAAEELDNSGEVFDYDSSKPNFEKWSEDQFTASNGLSKGNVRAMHTAIAAGKLIEISYNDDDKAIEGCAKVVDEGEWQKVLEGVYTGFSMGGRYAKRWQENGQTRYTAVPVEVSLVDKPCIKSALFAGMSKSFMLTKADGTVEERMFKGVDMYIPTNDEILPVAQSLAKAAGKTDAEWLEYADEAREQLIAKHVAGETAQEAPEGDGDATEVVEGAAEVVEAGDGTDDAGDAPAEGADATKADAPAATNEVPDLQQGWQAKDGSFHVKKADALAHNDTLAKGDDTETGRPSLADQLAGALADVANIAKGDTSEEVPGDNPIPLNERLTSFAGFLSDPTIVEKSLYNVSRTANTMRECASLYIAVNQEAAKEGDGSAVPATILSAVETLGEGLIAMASEEVGELMERLRSGDGTESNPYCYDGYYCELAASTMGLEKADAEDFFAKAISVSGKDMARLQKIHDHASALGAVCKDAGEDDAEIGEGGASAGEGGKETPPADDEDETKKMAKAAGFDDTASYIADLAKRAGELDTIKPQVEQLIKDITALKSRPAPPAPRTHVVSKGEDVAGVAIGGDMTGLTAEQRIAKALEGLAPKEASLALIKVAQGMPRTISLQG